MGLGALGDAIGGLLGGGGDSAPVPGLVPTVKRQIKVDGTALSEEIDKQVESVVVTDRLRMPDSFVLTLRDPGRDILSKAKLKLGAKVTIAAGPPGAEDPDELMVGEVTSIEAEYDRLGTRAIVRGYDLLHRLSAGTRTRTFDNVTYADVVKKIATEAGLTAEVDSTPGTIDHVIQGNVSDLQFVYQLAQRCGFDVSAKDKTLLFKKPAKASTGPGPGEPDSTKALQLVWGQKLLEFRARLSAVSQVGDVKVRGWDTKSQEAVIGKADAATDSARLTTSPKKLAQTSHGKTFTLANHPVESQAMADSLAKAVADQVASAGYEATALVVGSPKFKSGVAVTVSKVDEMLAGDWVITTARHEFGNGPYRTHLEFAGRQDRSLLGLVGGGAATQASRPSITGVVIGVVTSLDDPDELGRVKVKYPWLGDDAESHWARVARPSAGTDYGFLWFPDSHEEVLVAFEHGDLAFPIVIGSLWSGANKPLAAATGSVDGGKFQVHGMVSPAGNKVMLFDKDSEAGITLVTAGKKAHLELAEGQKTLELFLDGKTLTIKTTGDLELSADGAIKIEAKKGLDIKAAGNVTIKGAKVGIN